MTDLHSISTPTNISLLISFFDLTNFAKMAKSKSDLDIFTFISEYYELIGEKVEAAGGIIVKFMGDGGIIVFPESLADQGVTALHTIKKEIDAWLSEKEIASKMHVKVNFGEVVCGKIGTKTKKHFDIFGGEVNKTAMLKTHGFSLTPQAFRILSPESRKLFKKHTPPMRYIPVDEAHRD